MPIPEKSDDWGSPPADEWQPSALSSGLIPIGDKTAAFSV